MNARPDRYLDDENPEATEEDFRSMRPGSEVLPPADGPGWEDRGAAMLRGGGGVVGR